MGTLRDDGTWELNGIFNDDFSDLLGLQSSLYFDYDMAGYHLYVFVTMGDVRADLLGI